MELDYLGVARCGCARAWKAAEEDNPENRASLAEFLKEAALSGLQIERCTTDQARARLGTHRCGKVEMPAPLPFKIGAYGPVVAAQCQCSAPLLHTGTNCGFCGGLVVQTR